MSQKRIVDRNPLIGSGFETGVGGNFLVAEQDVETATQLKRVETAIKKTNIALGSIAVASDFSTLSVPAADTMFTGTVLTYSDDGTGTATIDGATENFTNSTGVTLIANDLVLFIKKDTTFFASGLISRSGVGYPGSSTIQFFTAVNTVPGLPYQPLTQVSIFGAADGCVWSDDGVVVSYADAQTYTITRPSTSFDSCWGLVDSPNGPWVFVRRTVSSNGLHIVYNGVGTTHNYGNCQVLGTYDDHIWVWAGYKNGSQARRIVGISSTGTIAYDFTNATLNTLTELSNFTFGRAGGWGIVLWDSNDFVTVEDPTGTPAYVKYAKPSELTTTADTHIRRSVVSDTSLFWLSSDNTDRDYRRWNFDSATLTTFLDVLPVGFEHSTIATTGGVNVVISGHNGTDAAVCFNSGAGTTTEIFTNTIAANSGINIATTPDNEVIGKIRSDEAPSYLDTIIGIS
jgi:hypothetical protein